MKKGLIISIGVVAVFGMAAAIFIFLLMAKSPEQVVAAAEKKIDKIESVHFTIKETISAEGEDITMDITGDMVLPDKVKMNAETSAQGMKISFEQIMVGGKVYIKMPIMGDEWMKMPIDVEDMTGQDMSINMDPSDFLEYLKANTKVEDLGDEEVNGKNCYHYSIDIDEEELISLLTKDKDDDSMEKLIKEMYEDAEIDLEVWIGKDDSLLYKEKVKMEVKSPDKMTIDATIKFSDYNKDVTIEEPKDAKEFKLEMPDMPEDFKMPTDVEGLEIPEGVLGQ